MTKVKFPLALAVVQGLYPAGTTYADFESIEHTSTPGFLTGVFKGTLEEAQALGMQEHIDAAPAALIPIIIDAVTGDVPGFENEPNQYTVEEGTNVVATGTLAIPDRVFRVPFRRTDTGRINFMKAEVAAGQFTLTMNFKTGGLWVVNDELINMGFDKPLFTVEPHTFAVM